MKTNQELNTKCGQRLRELLKEKQISQKKLAEKTNFTTQYISNIINGKKPMTISAAAIFSSILSTSMDFLLCKSDYVDPKEEEMSDEEFRKNVENFDYCMGFILQSFDICYHGIMLEDSEGQRRYLYDDYRPFLLDENEFSEFETEDGRIFKPVKVFAILLICEKKFDIPMNDFRILIKDIYEYFEFRTLKFTQKYIDKEPYHLFKDWFEKTN